MGVVAVAVVLVQGALLAAMASTVGLSPVGWAVGLACGVVLTALAGHGLAVGGEGDAGAANRVTLFRGLLACTAAALAAESLIGRDVTTAVLAVAVPALLLDAVDGWVARRTRTVSEFGGRFDGEVDAFLILVLSIYVAPIHGWWVLAAGLARYAFLVAGWVLPWMRGRLEYRHWRKVVTATAGIVLVVAAADVLPRWLTVTGLVVGLALLAESFGRDVWWLWGRRDESAEPKPLSPRAGGRREGLADNGSRSPAEEPEPPPAMDRRRRRRALAVNVLAVVLVWFALLSPNQPDHITVSSFFRLPVEVLVVAGLAVALPARWTRRTATVVGSVLGVLTFMKMMDLAAFLVLDRPFDPVTDRGLLGSGIGFVRDSVGTVAAIGAALVAVGLACAVVVCLPLAVGRLTRPLARRRGTAARWIGALTVVWVAAAVAGVRVGAVGPVAAAGVGPYVVGKVRAAEVALRDQARFDAAVGVGPLRGRAGDLAGLRGKDVVVAFVESYGRVALEGQGSSDITALLDAGTTRLRASGYDARSAFLTSPTFGGNSWLAHATLKSGLWVDNQWHYERLLARDRTTLTSAFGDAGWRTVGVLPSNRTEWPEGEAFYGFDEVYDRTSLGYAGPRFGFSAMPDQYALAAFAQRELSASGRAPVMAEIDLTSSHGPWAPLPMVVDWSSLGNGAVFHGIRDDAVTAGQLWSDRGNVPAAYRSSIVYSLTSLLSFVERYGNDDLVLVLLGDHQPSTIVSGHGANRDVPITVIARDDDVLDEISGWRWHEGLRPAPDAPVWRMDAFRDRFLVAYSDPATIESTQSPP